MEKSMIETEVKVSKKANRKPARKVGKVDKSASGIVRQSDRVAFMNRLPNRTVVTTKRTNRKYQVVGNTPVGPLFRFLKPETDNTVRLHGPTMLLNPRRYTVEEVQVVTSIVSAPSAQTH